MRTDSECNTLCATKNTLLAQRRSKWTAKPAVSNTRAKSRGQTYKGADVEDLVIDGGRAVDGELEGLSGLLDLEERERT